jgi:adenine-specific DNA-methyltransferase
VPTLEFKGKPFVYSHHLSVPFRELILQPDKSLPAQGTAPSLDDNLIIRGDNLEALKALLPRYAGKVDLIYIDPPYNTGNEGWAYNDNVTSPLMKEWLGKVVDAEDLERYDKWLCMMWPRLQLLSSLLSETGAIFASIEDTEQAPLVQIMSEIMQANYLGTIPVVNNMKGRNDKGYFARAHEYLVVFARPGFVSRGLPLTPKQLAAFKYTDERGERFALRDMRKRGGADTRELRENLYFPVFFDAAGENASLEPFEGHAHEVYPLKSDGTEGCWKWGKDKVEANLAILRMSNGRKGSKGVAYRLFLDPEAQPGGEGALDEEDEWDEETEEPIERVAKPKSFWWGPELSTDGAGKQLKAILGVERAFDYPKPVALLERIITLAAPPEGIVLDSFAGSGTTAHAVLSTNKSEVCRRKFVLVQLPEALKEDSQGYKAGYKEVVEITAERVRRVIKGVPDARDEALRNGLEGSFTYCELGEPMDLERFFGGEGTAPAWDQVARYVAYTATGETLVPAEGPDGFAGHAGAYRLHLLYKPEAEWMRSNEAMLDLTTAERIAEAAKADGGKPVLVFAAGKLMGQRTLTDLGITFCQLPYSVHRILGEGTEGVAGVDAA